MPSVQRKRIRPYTKHIFTGKYCQWCGKPIYAMRRDRIPQAIACSHACLWKLKAKHLKERPIAAGRYRTNGVHVSTGGYVFVRKSTLPEALHLFAEQMAPRSLYVQAHRIAMAEKLGRALLPRESVHHRDGNKRNNSIDNLELWVGGHGDGVKASDLCCPHCGKVYA